MKRRSVIQRLSSLLLTPALAVGETQSPAAPALRIAHITDVHLGDKPGAAEKFTRCLHHIQQHTPKVDLILNGGDIVFDMNKENLSVIGSQ